MGKYESSRQKLYKTALAATFIISSIVTVAPTSSYANDAEFTPFKDIKKTDYFYESVLDLHARGIVQGIYDGSFKPQQEVTRGQAAKILALVLGLDTQHVNNPGFTDVPNSNQYYGSIAALVQAGIINGYDDKTFKPSNRLTRAHLAKIINKGFGLGEEQLSDNRFEDVKSADWYAVFIQSLISNNITTGSTPTTFSPDAFVTRGQLASFVTRSEAAFASRTEPQHVSSEPFAELTSFAGDGTFEYRDGKASAAAFRTPHSIVTLADGAVIVSDSYNQIIREIKSGEVATFAGMALDPDERFYPQGGWHDSDRTTAVFNQPSGMTVDEQGNLYIADTMNHAIRKISTNGQVSTIAGSGLLGEQDGAGENARFYQPQDIAVASDGTLYVADTLNHTIRKISVDGKVSTLNTPSLRPIEIIAGNVESAGDFQDGNLKDARFNEPSGLVIDEKGKLYVSDSGNQLIRYIDFSTDTVTTVAGNLAKSHAVRDSNALYVEGGYADGVAMEASFNFPKGLALTKENGILIADRLNHSVRYLKDGQVTTLIGNTSGKKDREKLYYPTDVTVHPDGSILVVDSYNNSIRRIKLLQK